MNQKLHQEIRKLREERQGFLTPNEVTGLMRVGGCLTLNNVQEGASIVRGILERNGTKPVPTPASADSHGVFGLEASMRRIESGDIREAEAKAVVYRLRECRSIASMWCDELAEARLTDEEREAILLAVEHGENASSLGPLRPIWTLTLRRLLERTK